MGIFDKCENFNLPDQARAAGVYPYFLPIEESTATEARIGGKWRIMVGSNNYLGLTHHPKILEAARRALTTFGSGATGSRFLNGTLTLHYELEERLAALFHKQASLVFTTGYQANVGVISALMGRDDHLFIDRLDHASIVDGALMAYGELHRYAHNDAAALDAQLGAAPETANKLVVTDGVFSMEGAIADLPRLVETSKRRNAAIMVDEAHAIGVCGATGAGTVEQFGLADQVDLIMGTFSKSLASVGGVIAGPKVVIDWLRHHSRALIYTASMPPASVAGVLAALDVMRDEPERRERLWANTRRVADGLRVLGFDIGKSETPIIPVVIGGMMQVGFAWRALFDAGVFTHPIIPPAVPANSCRLRVSMSAEHTEEQIERVLGAFERIAKTTAVAS